MLGKAKSKNFVIRFVFRSLNRTFGLEPKVLTLGKTQKYLVFRSLNRTFAKNKDSWTLS